MLTLNYKFKLTRFSKALVLQILEVDTDFWTDLTTLFTAPHATTYTASNGVVISFAGTSSITNIASNALQLSNNITNISTATFASDLLRDTAFEKAVAAIKELVHYVLNDGTLPHTCHYCFNFYNYDVDDHFCQWIEEPNEDWVIDTHYCANYNVVHAHQLKYEVYEF